MKQNCLFPETVEHKSCTATIYKQIHREAERFEVRYYDVDGSIQRLTFSTYSSAKEFAETAVKEIAVNREHFITLRGRAALEFQTAIETLTPLGLTIVQAATLTIIASLPAQERFPKQSNTSWITVHKSRRTSLSARLLTNSSH
jgi:hypothetical protein